MSSSKPAVPEPKRIGRYEIVQKLGAGAFGTVYKGVDQDLGRPVAIKTIRLEGLAASQASLEDLLARFKREAQVAAKVKHPNIVTIYEIGNAEGLSYISMEFVDGVGLDGVIAKSGKMSVERAAAIGAQVADALDFAWRQEKLVHRDIKPANIMIEPGDRVKVTDFGIAKATDSGEHLTMTGSLLGTPSYMSPEQARGAKVDGRSDLFSVGCILYEMLAGHKAFRGESITALLFKIITEEPPSLRELDPTVSDEMLRIIGKALAKSPESRYQSGRELADDLLAVTRPGFVPTLRATDTPTLPPDAPPGSVPTIASPPDAPAGGHHRLGRDRGPAGEHFGDAAGPRGAAAPAPDPADPADRARGVAVPRREGSASRTPGAAARLATGSPQGRRDRPDRRPRPRRRPGPRRDRGRRVVPVRPEGAGARAEPGRRLGSAHRDSRTAPRGHPGTAGGDAGGGRAHGGAPRHGAGGSPGRPASRTAAPPRGRRHPPRPPARPRAPAPPRPAAATTRISTTCPPTRPTAAPPARPSRRSTARVARGAPRATRPRASASVLACPRA